MLKKGVLINKVIKYSYHVYKKKRADPLHRQNRPQWQAVVSILGYGLVRM